MAKKWAKFPYPDKAIDRDEAAVKKAWARLHRGDAEPPMQRLGAVVTDSHDDAARVEELPDVMRVHAVDDNAHQRRALAALAPHRRGERSGAALLAVRPQPQPAVR